MRLRTRTQNTRQDSNKASAKRSTAVMEPCEGRQLFSTYVVTTTADSGAGSLRDAIKATNSHSGADVINFSIGSGIKTIQTLSGLPYIREAVTIDATTQPGYAGKPLIELRGDKSGGYGLTLGGGNSTVRGLVINRYSSGILIVNGGGDTVQNCYIGTGYSGNTDWGNTDKGIIVQTANNLIGGTGRYQGNVISGNGGLGLQLYTYTAANNKVQGNFIGTNQDGSFAIANGTGIGVNGAPGTLIGGMTASARNVISGNRLDGVVVNTGGATGTVVQGNYIGTDATGTKRIGNGNYGVETSQPYTTVGGAASGSGNLISGNGYTGVVLWLASGSYSTVQNNLIGTDVTGHYDLGNTWRGVDVSNGSHDNLVKGNVISGNDLDGIMLYQGYNNTIASNYIGFDTAPHTKALPNSANGIRFTNTTSAYVTGNLIGNNGGYGLLRTGGGVITLVGNTLINDAIFNL